MRPPRERRSYRSLAFPALGSDLIVSWEVLDPQADPLMCPVNLQSISFKDEQRSHFQ